MSQDAGIQNNESLPEGSSYKGTLYPLNTISQMSRPSKNLSLCFYARNVWHVFRNSTFLHSWHLSAFVELCGCVGAKFYLLVAYAILHVGPHRTRMSYPVRISEFFQYCVGRRLCVDRVCGDDAIPGQGEEDCRPLVPQGTGLAAVTVAWLAASGVQDMGLATGRVLTEGLCIM